MRIFGLAFDHRSSYQRDFFGIAGEPTPVEHARCREGKRLIFEGMRRALRERISIEWSPAILIDDQYGAEIARAAAEAGMSVALALEKSGQAELTFEHDPFYQSILDLEPAYAKVLVRYNPDGDREMNRRQRQKIRCLQDWLEGRQTRLMVELLVPPEPDQLESIQQDRDRYDIDFRPALTVRAIHELAELGVAPRYWKLEGMMASADYCLVAEAVLQAVALPSECLVLGRGADARLVRKWITLAAASSGFSGFAVGRTIWWDPLRGYFFKGASREQTTKLIAENYLDFVQTYLNAVPAQ